MNCSSRKQEKPNHFFLFTQNCNGKFKNYIIVPRIIPGKTASESLRSGLCFPSRSAELVACPISENRLLLCLLPPARGGPTDCAYDFPDFLCCSSRLRVNAASCCFCASCFCATRIKVCELPDNSLDLSWRCISLASSWLSERITVKG